MKTLFINAVSCRVGGGLNDLVHTVPLLHAQLDKNGWSMHLWVSPQGAQALQQAGFPSARLVTVDTASPARRALWEFHRFPRMVRERSPDLVLQFANFALRNLPVPQVTVLRSQSFFSDSYEKRGGLYQRLRHLLGRSCSARTVERSDEILCVSDSQRQCIVAALGPLAEKVRTSHLGVECPQGMELLSSKTRDEVLALLPAAVREQLTGFAASDRKIVLNVGHYYANKNLGDLLQAARALTELKVPLTLLMTAGIARFRGPHDARTRRERALARELTQQGVLCDLGNVPNDVAWKLLALADVLAFPSSIESFGHPLLEAMRMGVPVVAADTPTHREITAGCALFHPVGNPQRLAAEIAAVLDGTVAVASLVTAAKGRTKHFSWQNHVGDLSDCIESAYANSNQNPTLVNNDSTSAHRRRRVFHLSPSRAVNSK